ncbi:acetyl-CoA synthetase-like protein [Lophiostoma macrostomum CBS 122681]|uniref:Acetyl-CoA synthetase-like protein n=1 Tax=Lophiostoma macrostomum CBS 122681 TaxID=1314788 RepID=A0A6A6SKM6_9PLEO|nr:acetyl-CoA synthetase-like protein [Lophiostoma macrostomum CBS 122681]
MVFLTGSRVPDLDPPVTCQIHLSVEELLAAMTPCSADVNEIIPVERPEAGAYLCFTSGSSGHLKGVLCTHGSLVAFRKDHEVRLNDSLGRRIAQYMSPGFDGSIHEIFSALSYGATLVLRAPSQKNPFSHLGTADAAILTPSIAAMLDVNDYPRLRYAYFVGEPVSQRICDSWAGHKAVYNMYGPTETTCGATIKRLQTRRPVTLGSPNPSTRIYIMNDREQLSPLGMVGEIYLSGIQVAKGYIGRPKETESVFLPDTNLPHYGESMYRTGDRGYWNGDGELVLVGRSDRQIKLHGYRIDLNSLETHLKSISGCIDAAIALRDDYLVAQIQPAYMDPAAFTKQLRDVIPAYSMPRYILPVASLPLTSAGKTDYRAIASHDYGGSHGPVAIPETFGARLVQEAIRNVFGLSPGAVINMTADLFHFGGTSIQQLALSHKLSQERKYDVPIGVLFDCSSLQELAESLESLDESTEGNHAAKLGDLGVSPTEREWLHKYSHKDGSPAFNVHFACTIDAGIDAERLLESWNIILSRRRMLNSHYMIDADKCASIGYRGSPPRVREIGTVDAIQEINTLINPFQGPLIRSVISSVTSRRSSSCSRKSDCCTIMSHSRPLRSRTPRPIGTHPHPMKIAFWKDHLSNYEMTEFSIGRIQGRSNWSGSSSFDEIPDNTLTSMKEFAQAHNCTMHQICLASVSLALQYRTAACDIVVGAPYLNRHSEEDQNVVGLFLEPLPIRIRYPPTQHGSHEDEENVSFIEHVKLSSRDALAHAMPWDQLRTHLGHKAQLPNQSLLDVMVTYQEPEHVPLSGIAGLRPMSVVPGGAKFTLVAESTSSDMGGLMLRLEYSDECFGSKDITTLHKLIQIALQGIVGNREYRELREDLRPVHM